MFRITEDSSSGSLVQCLAKNCKNDSIVSFDMDKVGVMAAYSDPLCVCVVQCIWRLPVGEHSVIRNMLAHFKIFYNFNCIYMLYIVH